MYQFIVTYVFFNMHDPWISLGRYSPQKCPGPASSNEAMAALHVMTFGATELSQLERNPPKYWLETMGKSYDWLVVSTHLKNMLVKLDHSPK